MLKKHGTELVLCINIIDIELLYETSLTGTGIRRLLSLTQADNTSGISYVQRSVGAQLNVKKKHGIELVHETSLTGTGIKGLLSHTQADNSSGTLRPAQCRGSAKN